jgi:hypothetical protein
MTLGSISLASSDGNQTEGIFNTQDNNGKFDRYGQQQLHQSTSQTPGFPLVPSHDAMCGVESVQQDAVRCQMSQSASSRGPLGPLQ